MADKKSFVFYHQWAELLKKLPTDEVGNITLALIEYSESGTVPELSQIADIVFTAFKQTIDKDTEKWEDMCQKNAENGRKGGRPRKANGYDEISKKPNGFSENPKEPKKADNENEYEYDNDKELNTPLPPKGGETADNGFEKFWKAYPKKVAKTQALKAWSKLKPNAELQQIILNALERQKQSAQWQKDNGQFIPYPATWLNGRRWEDMQEQVSQPAPKKYEYDPDNPYANWD